MDGLAFMTLYLACDAIGRVRAQCGSLDILRAYLPRDCIIIASETYRFGDRVPLSKMFTLRVD